jgi:ribosomal protein L1
MGANRTLGLDAPVLAEAYRDTRVWARADKAGNLSLPVGSSSSASDLEENVLSTGFSRYRLVGHSLPSLRVA